MIEYSKFMHDEQDPKAVEKVFSRISDILSRDEEVLYIAVQKRPAVTILPDCVVMSSKKIFFCSPANLGLTMNIFEFPWSELVDVYLKEEIFGAKFSAVRKDGNTEVVEFIPKVQARRLYKIGKEKLQEQRMEAQATKEPAVAEKPDSLEPPAEKGTAEHTTNDLAAFEHKIPTHSDPAHSDPAFPVSPAYKGFDTHSYSEPEPKFPESKPESHLVNPIPAIPEKEDEITEKLKQLKSLFDRQLISKEDYESKKIEILSRF